MQRDCRPYALAASGGRQKRVKSADERAQNSKVSYLHGTQLCIFSTLAIKVDLEFTGVETPPPLRIPGKVLTTKITSTE